MSEPEKKLRPRAIGLRHLALSVADLFACERFYVDVIGFLVEWRPDADNVYLRYAGDNLALHRYVPAANSGATDDKSQALADEEAFSKRRGQHLGHLGIVVPRPADVDAWAAHLVAAGIKIHGAPRTHRDGARSFYVDDPDGNPVQFIYHPPISDEVPDTVSIEASADASDGKRR